MKLAGYALVAVMVLLAPGCVQVEETVTLGADGSGILELTYGMSEERIAAMEAEAGAMAPPEAGSRSLFDFDEETIRAEFKDMEAEGVLLEAANISSRNGWKYVAMRIRFPSLEALTRTPLMSDRHVTLTKDGEDRYVFRLASPGGASAVSPAGEDPEAEKLVRDMMKGLRVVVRIRTPGDLVDTTAAERGPNEAVWRYDLAADPDALRKLEQADMSVTFQGKDLALKPFQGGERTSCY